MILLRGREEGREEGREKGREEGREEGRLLLLEELVRSGCLTMEEAAAAVHVTVAELEDAFEELQ